MPGDLKYRKRAESLLSQAAAAENMAERGRLIDEAVYWRLLALDAADADADADRPVLGYVEEEACEPRQPSP